MTNKELEIKALKARIAEINAELATGCEDGKDAQNETQPEDYTKLRGPELLSRLNEVWQASCSEVK